MHARFRLALLALGAVVCFPVAPARAQSLLSTSSAPAALAAAPQAGALGPSRASLSVGVRLRVDSATAAPAARGAGVGHSEALMIVGGAAILVGAIIGDSPGQVIMIGGAVVGLYGLYQFLQ